MSRRNSALLITAIISLVLALLQLLGWLDPLLKSVEVNQPGTYTVTQYVDGDTIAVDMNGKTEKIRFIGIDTPETHKPNTPVQCYGPAAAAHTKTIISRAGGRVRLAADPLGTNRDRYNRLLRYIYLPNGTLVNELNIREGYAFYYPYFPFTKKVQFAAAQSDAQKNNRGLWGNCTPVPTDRGGYTMPPANQ
jgi:endonuclease YncB( thermonuclease family)